jgi:hypothetical protein
MSIISFSWKMDDNDHEDDCDSKDDGCISHFSILKDDRKRFEGDHLRKKRHGARNQHKTKNFVNWLVQQKFFDKHDSHRILDIAGGKGELSARLLFCCGIEHVTQVDPRDGANIASVYHQLVVPKLPRKWQQQYLQRCIAQPNFPNELVRERFTQLAMYFTHETVAREASLREKIESSSLLIGMHADSATECIVDVALQYRKPFVVVPCCVFPNLFPQRFVATDDIGAIDPAVGSEASQSVGHRMVPVRTYEHFCDYLEQKDARFQRSVLPFEGRNVAIWWDGI